MLHRMSFFVALVLFIGGLFLPVFVQAQSVADTVTYTPADTALANQLFVEMKALIDQQKWEEAKEKGAKAQLIYGKLLGEESGKVADVLHLLGNIAYFRGDYNNAVKYWKEALQIKSNIASSENLDIASSYNNIGNAKLLLGHYDGAIENFQKSLDIRLKLLGSEHSMVSRSLDNLGIAYQKKGEYDNAIEYKRKALNIRIKALGEEHQDMAVSYNNLGVSYMSKGLYDEAIQYYQKALVIRLKFLNEKHPDVANSYSNLGSAFKYKGQYDKAIEYEIKALEINLSVFGAERPNIAQSYNALGRYHFNKGEYDKAVDFFQKSLFVWQKIFGEEHPEVAQSLNDLGDVYLETGDHEKAIEFLQKALGIRLKLLGGEHPNVATSFVSLGDYYLSKGENGKALNFYQQALVIRLKTLGENHPEVSNLLADIGAYFEAQGEFDNAIKNYQQSLTILVKNFGSIHPSVASLYNRIGVTLDSKGEYNKAIEYYQKALGIYLITLKVDHPEIASVLNNIGFSYFRKNDYFRAAEFYEKSLFIRLEVLKPDHPDVASSYNNMAGVYMEEGDYDKAIKNLDKALGIYLRQYGTEHHMIASVFNNLALAYKSKGDKNKAIDFERKALDIRLKKQKNEHPDIATSMNNLALSYRDMGEWDKAIEWLRQALEIRLEMLGAEHPSVSKSYNNLAFSFKQKNEFKEALLYYSKALIACRYDRQGFQNLSSAEQSLIALRFSSETLEKQYTLSPAPSLLQQSLSYAQEALAAIDYQSSSFTSESSKTHWQSENHPIYEQAIDISLLAADVNHNDSLSRQTFTYAEKSKATQLQAQLKNANALAFSGIPDSLTQKEYQLRVDLSWREKQRQALLDKGRTESDSTVLRLGSIVFDLRQQYDSLKTRFEKNYPAYYRLKYDLSTVSLQYAQDSLLQPDQTLLEYFVGDSSIYIFLVQPKNYEVIEIKKDTAFEQWIEDLTRNGIYGFYGKKGISKGKSINNFGTSAHQLYQTLIAPVKAKLGEKLIIIPDGILGYIPFEALLTEKPPRPDAMLAYKYLIQDHQISYCYSATLLKEMRNKKHHQEPTQKLLAMAPFFLGNADTLLSKVDSTELLADVVLRDTLTALPNSGTEVASVSKILKGQAFYGKEATLQKFQDLASRYSILHLSTHGKADDRLGDYAYLAFGMPNAGGTFDKLYARDLYNLSLNADLVVLSACETGIGKLQRGEGIVSLARAFAYAGAKSIVTTLWKVSDEQSKNLMSNFYKNLSMGKEKDEALRLAKLDFLKANTKRTELLHPFFWASFIGIGDMRKLK